MDLSALATYRATVDHTLRRKLLNELVVAEDALVRRCARRLAKGPADEDDLMQAGRIGVLRAIEKFDPSRGAWTQYAKQWIYVEMDRGVVAMRSDLRTKKMPKEVYLRAKEIERTTGRSPTAEQLGVSEEDLAIWRTKFVGYGENAKDVTGDGSERVDSGARVAWANEAMRVSASRSGQTILTPAFWRALASLPEVEARVFLGIVVDEKQVKEVAASEGYEERWATATYRRAVEKLRVAMKAVPAR